MGTCRPASTPLAAGLAGTLPFHANDAMTGVRAKTGGVAETSAYSARRGDAVHVASPRDPATTTTTNPAAAAAPGSGGGGGNRPSGTAPCTSSPPTSAKSVGGVSASEYTWGPGGGDGGRGGHGLGASPATSRRGEGGRQSRMDATSFRLRVRKGGGEGVTKKGPMVAKHPSTSPSSSSTTSSPTTTTTTTTTSPSSTSAAATTTATTTAFSTSTTIGGKEVRSPVGPGPPGLGSHRRRPGSPDPRAHARTRAAHRDSPRTSPKTSPRSSPKSSPVRQVHRERSVSPRRYVPRGGGVGGRGPGTRVTPSPPNKRATPPTSPRRGAAPSPGARRPASPTSSSQRPPSPGSRRPPSPRGTSPRGRGTSPGSRGPPISEEALRARVRRALNARLYLLHQPGPNSFTVGGDSPTHKYKVIIGPQTCSCGHGPYCVHVMFVMVRVLQVGEANPVLLAGTLKDYEIEQLMGAYQERRKKAAMSRERRQGGGSGGVGGGVAGGSSGGRHSPSNTPTGTPSPHSDSSAGEEESQCPICLMCMVEGESLVACEAGCRNQLHHHCMAVWAADRHAQGQPLLCPLCRAPWPLKHHPRLAPAPPTAMRPPPTTSAPAAPTQDFASVMSASFSGVLSSSSRHSPAGSPSIMSRSLSSAYPSTTITTPTPYHPTPHSPFVDSAYSSPGGGMAYPPTVRGEVSAAAVVSASQEAVPLPRSEPIPEEHESTAANWVHVFGKELVACLFSRDWVVRETGLRRLAHEVVKVLHWDRLVTGEEKRQLVIHCCANILAQVANDPVYKVYLACLACLRVLLAHLSPCPGSQVAALQELLRPLVHTLLLKCADGNRRTSQISVDSILELSRGQEGELALATQTACPTPGLGGISFVLSCILDDTPPSEAPWQWLLGRLCVLDRLLDKFPSEFQLQYMPLQAGVESGYKLEHYDRLVTVVEFAFKALGSSHATVSKLARRVYICGARFAAAEPAVFYQVCDMLTKLDVLLQTRLKRRLQSMQGQHGDRKLSAARLEGKLSLGTWDLADGSGPRLVRSVSHSPSRMLSALRSSSQSPARQPLLSASAKKEAAKVPPGPTSSPPRPTHLPLDCFEVNFKKKQAKLRLCQKMKKHDVPFMVHNVLVSPMQQQQHQRLSSAKAAGVLHKSGLSQSQGDALDVSPQTPIASVVPPKFSFKDVVSTPTTPKGWWGCTPIREAQASQSSWAPYETPLPVIPGLELLPPHLDESLHPQEQNVEGGQYEEGRDWILGPKLGTGAFSSCYQARDVRTGTLMAVKQVSFSRNDEEEQERVEASIEQEILIMSRLRHCNIVRLLGASRHSTSFSVFTEWMAGGSVAMMLDKYGIFSEEVILKYTRQVLEGLAYLHDNKILHRDLKGANLLVDSTGQWLRIGDFGTAARMASKSTVTGEFQGQLRGTIAFMAPEVLRGEDYGRSCDMWSVGCCVIEMATTKPPWEADYVSNELKLMYKIASSNGPPPVPETLSAVTRDLALRCLEIKSENRPPAKELIHHQCFKTQPP
ncbi:mitogen-activated protein kinase kinase kinase 1-like [Scylla paramamosain]|uniref:mitogen-activated protein kinase kinase kinase 1-like n=1 Tax=Scylla paramamosain TaxID=85552 RepID=UPI003082B41F